MNDFEKKLIDFKAIVLELEQILKEENQALESFEINKATSMYAAKTKAVNLYRDFVAFFIKRHKELEALKEEDKNILRSLIDSLNNNLSRNEVLLKTRIDVSKNVMNSIINVAKTTNNSNSTSYGSMGNYAQREKHYNSIAINQTL